MNDNNNGNGQPHREFYNGRGYGYLTYHAGTFGGRSWLSDHYEKYPKGKLPEQKLVVVRSKS